MNKFKIVSIILGIVVVSGAFLSVFGSSLKNLQVDNAQDIQTADVLIPSTNIPEKTITPSTTTVPATQNNYRRDDEEDENGEYGNYTPPITTPSTNQTTPPPAPVPTPTPTPPSGGSSYTLAQIGAHNSATSCWSTINGGVYDLTSWVNSHPGGKAAILMICGKDGSALFNMQHGGQSRPNSILSGFKIGTLQ